jgi:hypothetical protein
MAIDFVVKDVIHRVAVKFVNAYLPNAKKAFHLKAVYQPEIDIHGIASKADTYNITTSNGSVLKNVRDIRSDFRLVAA